jgi:hypothetical protein
VRQSSEAVTRRQAQEVSQLMDQAGIIPSTLSVLIGESPSVLNRWFVFGVRPSLAVQRKTRATLKAIIEIQGTDIEEHLNMNDAAQLRRLLQDHTE